MLVNSQIKKGRGFVEAMIHTAAQTAVKWRCIRRHSYTQIYFLLFHFSAFFFYLSLILFLATPPANRLLPCLACIVREAVSGYNQSDSRIKYSTLSTVLHNTAQPQRKYICSFKTQNKRISRGMANGVQQFITYM